MQKLDFIYWPLSCEIGKYNEDHCGCMPPGCRMGPVITDYMNKVIHQNIYEYRQILIQKTLNRFIHAENINQADNEGVIDLHLALEYNETVVDLLVEWFLVDRL